MSDTFNLERFKAAQDVCYHKVKTELRAGQKRSHWIWYVFPQIKGLGQSHMDATYAIQCAEEARAYLADPLLSGRLKECINLLMDNIESDIRQIMGSPDDLKLCSSMTLFLSVAEEHSDLYQGILDKFYSGKPDVLTLNILNGMSGNRPN